MKNKLITSILAALLLVGTTSVTAFANPTTEITEGKADGIVADTPVGSEEGNASTGSATVSGTEGSFSTVGDDDDKAGSADTNGSDINVWGKVTEENTPVYKVDITWGAMKFEFKRAGATWDPETHTYDDDGEAEWVVENYLKDSEKDGEITSTNNKITVTNHSNADVDAKFTYAMDSSYLFNPESAGEGANIVRGNFFETAANALEASKQLEGTKTVANTLTNNTISLKSADNKDGVDDGQPAPFIYTDEVYFAFSGTPDEGVGDISLNEFKKVGVINVGISPKATP